MPVELTPELRRLLAQPRVRVRVTPNARKSDVFDIDGDTLNLRIAAPPEDGKANKEVERFLTRLSGKRATIKTGRTSKDKTVALED